MFTYTRHLIGFITEKTNHKNGLKRRFKKQKQRYKLVAITQEMNQTLFFSVLLH